MTTRDSTHLLRRLNPHCARTLEAAASLCQTRLSDEITVEHWLLKLIEADEGDIPAILRHYEIDVDAIWNALLAAIDRQPRNLRGMPSLSIQLASVLQDAWNLASREDMEGTIRSAHLLRAIADVELFDFFSVQGHADWPCKPLNNMHIPRCLRFETLGSLASPGQKTAYAFVFAPCELMTFYPLKSYRYATLYLKKCALKSSSKPSEVGLGAGSTSRLDEGRADFESVCDPSRMRSSRSANPCSNPA